MFKARLKVHHLIALLLAAAPLAVFRLPALPGLLLVSPLPQVFSYAPYLLFLLFSFLALRLNLTIGFYTGLLLILAYSLLSRSLVAPLLDHGANFYALMFALIIPPSLLLFFLLGESALFGVPGLLRLWLCLGLPVCFLLTADLFPALLARALELDLLSGIAGWRIPDISLLLFACLPVILLLTGRRGSGFFKYSLLVSGLSLYWVLDTLLAPSIPAAGLRLSVGMFFLYLTLLYGLYRLYWQKVYIDELTGVPNRRAFDEMLGRLGRQYSLAMIDIDHFKQVNDTYGHGEGDNVLRWVATHAAQETPQLYRYGGEEFAVIFPQLSAAEAMGKAEALRAGLAGATFYLRSPGRGSGKKQRKRRKSSGGRKVRLKITVSIGVAQGGQNGRKSTEVLALADKALYEAKRSGRNRVVCA
jgi:GGDEF domain-containing protein